MKTVLRLVIGALFSIAIAGYLISQVSLGELARTLSNASFLPLLAAFGMYLAIVFIRALRFRFLLRTPIPLLDMNAITAAYSLFVNTLPFKSGEMSYVLITKRQKQLRSGERIASWFVSRIFDFIALGGIFFAVFIISRPDNYVITAAFYIVAIMLAVLISGLALIIFQGKRANALVQKIASAMRVEKIRIVRYGLSKVSGAVDAIAEARSPRILLTTLTLSIIIWMLQALILRTLLAAFGFPGINLTNAIIVLLISGLILLLPIPGLANFGTYEAGMTLALTSIGFATANAIALSVAIHIMHLVYLCIAGGVALLWLFGTSQKH